MTELKFRFDPVIPPDRGLQLDYNLLESSSGSLGNEVGVLRVYGGTGDVLSIGRYHLAPSSEGKGRTSVVRRLSGGRVVAAGEGFIGVSLVLPHRSALVSDHPGALAPHQIGNRYVRGILDALNALHVGSPFYPGRDLILSGGRSIGVLTFEVHRSGALLFEVILAHTRDLSIVTNLLDEADREGRIITPMIDPEQTTSIERSAATLPSAADIAEAIRMGFEKQFGIRVNATSGIEGADQTQLELSPDWVARRTGLDQLRSTKPSQLGMLDVHVAIDPQNRMEAVIFAGDLIANSSAIQELESRLCGQERMSSVVHSVVASVFAQPDNFVLGATPQQLAEMVMAAA